MVKVTEALGFMKKKTDVNMNVAETCTLIEFKEAHRNTHHEGGTSGNDSEEEEEDPRGGQQVRCNQQ